MNKILALKRHDLSSEASLFYARVDDEKQDGFAVSLNDGHTLFAQRAAGCLLAPETGDEVLLVAGAGNAFILSVLTRQEDTGRITLPGTSTIEGNEITLTGRRGVALEAPRISLTGLLGEASFSGLSLLSRWCDVRVERITSVAEIWNRTIGRLTERIRDSYRKIENTEQTKAGRIRTIVKERFSVASKNADLNAEEEVKLDGKKIHIG
jgi:hypothetical protein